MTPPYQCTYLICPFYFFVQRLNSADKHLNSLATKQKHTKKEMFKSYRALYSIHIVKIADYGILWIRSSVLQHSVRVTLLLTEQDTAPSQGYPSSSIEPTQGSNWTTPSRIYSRTHTIIPLHLRRSQTLDCRQRVLEKCLIKKFAMCL